MVWCCLCALVKKSSWNFPECLNQVLLLTFSDLHECPGLSKKGLWFVAWLPLLFIVKACSWCWAVGWRFFKVKQLMNERHFSAVWSTWRLESSSWKWPFVVLFCSQMKSVEWWTWQRLLRMESEYGESQWLWIQLFGGGTDASGCWHLHHTHVLYQNIEIIFNE